MSKYHFFTLPNTTAPINLITFLFLTMLQIMYESMKVKVENILNTVFGWGENREDGKQMEENRVENTVFHCLAKEGKCWGWKTREKILSRAHNFHPPKSGGKLWRKKCSHNTFTEMPSQLQTQRLQTQQSFSQTSLNSSITRLSKYKLKNTILKLIKS